MLTGRGFRVAGGRLVDDHAVRHRIGTGGAGIRAFQRRIVDQDGVQALHTGDLRTARRTGHARNLDIAGRVQQWGATAGRVQRGVGHGNRSAAAIGGE